MKCFVATIAVLFGGAGASAESYVYGAPSYQMAPTSYRVAQAAAALPTAMVTRSMIDNVATLTPSSGRTTFYSGGNSPNEHFVTKAYRGGNAPAIISMGNQQENTGVEASQGQTPIKAYTTRMDSTKPTYAISSQYHSQDELGNFAYGYVNPNSEKHEKGNIYSGVQGHYIYVDGHGLNRRTDYVADEQGFRATVDDINTSSDVTARRNKRSSQFTYSSYPGLYSSSSPVVSTAYPVTTVNPATTTVSASAFDQYLAQQPTNYLNPAAVDMFGTPLMSSKVSNVYGGGAYQMPTGYQTVADGVLTSVQNNPGHATSYRYYY